ncbi:MAG: DUF2157 domain-containing protein [Synechocystis sp.]
MKITKADLDWAVNEGHLSGEQAEILWDAWSKRRSDQPELNADGSPPLRFDFANVAFYFGALIVIAAMAFLVTLAWENLGGFGIFGIAVVYAISLTFLGRWLYFEQKLPIPGGLLITIAVWMTPLAIYGLQRGFGFWQQGDPGIYQDFHSWVKGSWFLMEMGTIFASLIALRFIRFPFLTFPLAFCLWYLSMDVAPLLFGADVEFKTRALVSLWFGIICLAIAYWVDLRNRRSQGDYAFWLYLFGLISFWFSLPFTGEDTEWNRLIYGLINLGLMVLSIMLKRRLFMVFGGLGVFGYISYLAFRVFADSLLFPFALSGLGLGIIAAGILYQRHYRHVEAYFDNLLPPHWRNLLPKER